MKTSRDLAPAVFTVLLSLLCSIPPFPALARESFETGRAIINCAFPSELYLMEKRLNFFPAAQYFQKNYQASGFPPDPVLHRLAAKVEGIMGRVSHLLNISLKPSSKLRIFLLKDGREVRERHLLFRPGRSTLGYNSLEAFYQPGTHSLFLSLADLHEGILAHEMAHFLLCAGSAVPPPAEVQERLAQYAEMHLREQATRGF
ncbi:MAG: hypothetical protein QME75_00415 [Deltaproteobacteria bacterium]|nr:hypothetical protein [Deltaproteobacteria bacterium]